MYAAGYVVCVLLEKYKKRKNTAAAKGFTLAKVKALRKDLQASGSKQGVCVR